MAEKKVRAAVFASGRGTNFGAIIQAAEKGKLPVELALLVSDKPACLAVKRARKAKIRVCLVKRAHFSAKKDFEEQIIASLEENNIDLIVLAGFMRVLSPEFVSRYKNKILNIHPSLLPAFKGTQAIKEAFDYGVKITGVTVHFVDELMDHGPIVLQAAVKIEKNESLKSLEAKIHKIEHQLYPQAIKLFSERLLKIKGRKVNII